MRLLKELVATGDVVLTGEPSAANASSMMPTMCSSLSASACGMAVATRGSLAVRRGLLALLAGLGADVKVVEGKAGEDARPPVRASSSPRARLTCPPRSASLMVAEVSPLLAMPCGEPVASRSCKSFSPPAWSVVFRWCSSSLDGDGDTCVTDGADGIAITSTGGDGDPPTCGGMRAGDSLCAGGRVRAVRMRSSPLARLGLSRAPAVGGPETCDAGSVSPVVL
mmetsp:Transcript_11245/g.46935  ORF Transcript_11245/g.46935 Transcript_11245/m.46935 type:complete len:224 (-) Transcript_11245:1428-2099(-)